MANGDTAVCFSGESLDRLAIKMVRYDSLLSANYYNTLMLDNYTQQIAIHEDMAKKKEKKINRLKKINHILSGSTIIMCIFALLIFCI